MKSSPIRTCAAASTVTLALSLAAAVAPSALAGASTPSAQAQYEAALKSVGTEGVHFTSTATQNGTTISVSGDTGETSGMQQLTVHSGSTVEHVTALLVGPTGYLKANAAALHRVIGLSNAQSSKYANRWLSFPTSNNGLAELVNGLLNRQISGELQMSGPYRYGTPTTVNGIRALVIHGSEPVQSGGTVPTTLYVKASGTHLPIKEVTNPGTGGKSSAIRGSVTFSNWGEKTNEKAPASSVSLLKLVPPSSGSSTSG